MIVLDQLIFLSLIPQKLVTIDSSFTLKAEFIGIKSGIKITLLNPNLLHTSCVNLGNLISLCHNFQREVGGAK